MIVRVDSWEAAVARFSTLSAPSGLAKPRSGNMVRKTPTATHRVASEVPMKANPGREPRPTNHQPDASPAAATTSSSQPTTPVGWTIAFCQIRKTAPPAIASNPIREAKARARSWTMPRVFSVR